MNELALFAGAGGGILGGKLLGWRTVCAVEIDPYARRVLLARQADGYLDRFPIWDDVRTFEGTRWRGNVDVISGGFPCQDISAAGKGAGITGTKSGLWSHMARIIGEVRPRFVFVENSPLLVSRGLAVVLGDLAAMGYDARWGVLGAHHVGAEHRRARLWLVANSYQMGRSRKNETIGNGRTLDSPGPKSAFTGSSQAIYASNSGTVWNGREQSAGSYPRWKDAEPSERLSSPSMDGMVDDVANRMDRLAAIGNGQVPAVVRLAWETLSKGVW